MPKRVVDGEALWRSRKMLLVPPEYRAEYANLLPLAGVTGSFECDAEGVWADVYSFTRPDKKVEDVAQILAAYEQAGMLLRWSQDGKTWAYFVGIDSPGRLPGKEIVARYKNPPPRPPKDSGKITQSHGDSDKSFKGSGSGLGEGIGSGSHSEKNSEIPNPGLHEAPNKIDELSIQPGDDIEIGRCLNQICLEVLGSYADPAQFRDTWTLVHDLCEAYGESNVVQAFTDWAESKAGEAIKYPVSDFVRVSPGLLKGITSVRRDPRLQPLITELTAISNGEVLFDNNHTMQIGRLLGGNDYTPEDIVVAFRTFYPRVEGDPIRLRTAANKFCEVALALIETRRRAIRRQQEMAEIGERLSAQREQEVVEEEAERRAKEAEEAELMEVDPLA